MTTAQSPGTRRATTSRARVDREIIKHLRTELSRLEKQKFGDEKLLSENAELKTRVAELQESSRVDFEWVRGRLAEAESRVNRATDHVAAITASIFNERSALAQSQPAKLQETIAAKDLEIECLTAKLKDTERKLRIARKKNL